MSRRSLLPSRSVAFDFGRDRDNLGGGGGDFDEDTGGPSGSSKKGGTGDADDDDDDADDSGSDDGDDDDDDADDSVPRKPDGTPYTQADIDALKKALRKERKAKRGAAADDTDDDDATDDKDAKPDRKAIERARAEGEEAAVSVWKPLVVNSAARAALSTAGLIGKPDRLLRLIDLEEIDVDPDTGEIDGLGEQVADLRKEYPHLFRKKGTRNLDAADKDGTRKPTSKMTATEIQAAQLRGEL